MANNAPYVYMGGKWVDANTNLAIRGKDSFSSANNKNVPTVNAFISNKWQQIYPPKEQSASPGQASTSSLIMWQGNGDSGRDRQIWGWAYGSNGNGYAATGYFGDGPKANENNILKEYCGWLNLTKATMQSAGYKGLGKVTKVSKIEIWVTHLSGTGYPAYKRKFGLIGTNVPNPRASNLQGKTSSEYNPCMSRNRSAIAFSDNSASLTVGGTTKYTFTSSTACNLFRDFMNGKYSAICSFNGSGRGAATVFQGNGRYELSKDYQKITKFSYRVHYSYEP